MCDVLSMSVDFVEKSGWLYVPDGQCPDMNRTIGFFKVVLPDISLIQTMSGIKEDVKYLLVSGKWVAMENKN